MRNQLLAVVGLVWLASCIALVVFGALIGGYQ